MKIFLRSLSQIYGLNRDQKAGDGHQCSLFIKAGNDHRFSPRFCTKYYNLGLGMTKGQAAKYKWMGLDTTDCKK